MNAKRMATICLAVALLMVNKVMAVDMETIVVGNPGNPADTRYDTNGFGSVSYSYSIGKYEVTTGQYCEFLNAMASKSDVYGLYNSEMWESSYGYSCRIERHWAPDGHFYTVDPERANYPVNYVSWGDAARFTNWLHNGQPTFEQDPGATEHGAYDLSGATTVTRLMAVDREANWKWAIASEDEWYKAAYHKNDGVTGNYWKYPTGTNDVPVADFTNPDPGNTATIDTSTASMVGSHENSASAYGTFDQGGNMREWTERIRGQGDTHRGLRGGGYYESGYGLYAPYSDDFYYEPTSELPYVGFRVVSVVPEPTTVSLFALCGLVVLRKKWRV